MEKIKIRIKLILDLKLVMLWSDTGDRVNTLHDQNNNLFTLIGFSGIIYDEHDQKLRAHSLIKKLKKIFYDYLNLIRRH